MLVASKNSESASRPEPKSPGSLHVPFFSVEHLGVLLFDPEAKHRVEIRRVLESRGHRVEVHTDFGAARNAWRSGALSMLVVTDPAGWKLCREVTRRRRVGTSQVLAFLDRAFGQEAEAAIAAGVDDFLLLPAESHFLEIRVGLAEQRLRAVGEVPFAEHPEFFRLLADTMNEGLGVRDTSGRVVYVNDYFCRMLGYGKPEVLGRPVSDFIDPGSAVTFDEEMRQRPRARSSSYELVMVRKDGRKILTLHAGQAIHSKEGTFQGSFAVITDLGEVGRRFQGARDALVAAEQPPLKLEAALRRAIDKWQFDVLYQPIMALETGRVAGMEALVRWLHPERGIVLPGEFISLAEETGLITTLGNRVLAEACLQMKEWMDRLAGADEWFIGVNLSARQLMQGDLVDQVDRVLRESGLPAARLVLELAEVAVPEPADLALPTLKSLKALGVRLSLDDFGTGPASLSALHRLPFDMVKIDRGFINNVGSDPSSDELVAGVLELCHWRQLSTVAEGVESEAQKRRLRQLGCAFAQGFLFAEPGSADQVETYLRGL